MKILRLLFSALKFKHKHDDNLRAFSDTETVAGYAVLVKSH